MKALDDLPLELKFLNQDLYGSPRKRKSFSPSPSSIASFKKALVRHMKRNTGGDKTFAGRSEDFVNDYSKWYLHYG